MDVATSNESRAAEAAAVFAPVAPEDSTGPCSTRGFPAWAPGARRTAVSFLGFGRRIFSVLEEAEAPVRLRRTYDGPVEGWGECRVERVGDDALASFGTALAPADPLLASLARGATARGAALAHLKRSLLRLGRLVAVEALRHC